MAENASTAVPKEIRILIVEDDSINQKFYRMAFSKLDDNLDIVSRADEALKYLRSNIPDIIIMDVVLPDLNGIELCKLVKLNSHTCVIPIIGVSAMAKIKNREQCLKAGMFSFLCKPVSIYKLFEQIRLATIFKTEKLD